MGSSKCEGKEWKAKCEIVHLNYSQENFQENFQEIQLIFSVQKFSE